MLSTLCGVITSLNRGILVTMNEFNDKLKCVCVITILLWCNVHHVQSQTPGIDSIRSVLDTVKVHSLHVKALHDLSSEFSFRNADTSEYYVDKALTLAKQHDYRKGLAMSYRQKAIVYYVRGELNEALLWFDSSMVVRQETGDIDGQVLITNNKALTYQRLGEFEKSKEMLLEALDLAETHALKKRKADIANNLGLYYSRFDRFDSALYYHRLSLGLNEELGNAPEVALLESNIGVIFFKQSDFQMALQHFQRAYELAVSSNSERVKTLSLHNMGLIYNELDLHERAFEIYEVQEKMLETTNNELNRIAIMANKAATYYESEQFQEAYDLAHQAIDLKEASELKFQISKSFFVAGSAAKELQKSNEAEQLFKQGLEELLEGELQAEALLNNAMAILHIDQMRYPEAEVLLMRNLDIKDEVSFPDVLSSTYFYLSKLSAGRDDHKVAFEYLELHKIYQDSLLDEQKANALIRSSIEFETERQELELVISREKLSALETAIALKNARTRNFVFIAVSLILLLSIVGIWRLNLARLNRLKMTQEAEKLKLENENKEIKNESLRRELELKHKQVVGQALQLAQKNEAIIELRQNLEKELDHTPNHNVRNSIKTLDKHVTTDADWKTFKSSFESVHENFFDQLQTGFSDLTPRELQLCALLRLNLSIKEMSNVLGISQEGTKKVRYRIRKKLGLTDSSMQLSAFLLKY